ncbi:MAG TPA: polysaccharide deacetylase family protein [Candidatus Baltobacteraceae bacterium]|nr:polysaccharide deacetylase family protein [Candidatus Baltobacteraceae bacterium]
MSLRRVALPAVALLAALALIGFAAYELFEQPTNQIFGRTLTRGPSNERIVALTYDDGPNPPYTSRILDVLEQEHVHATFFLVGRAVQAYPAVVRRELRDGNAIGNHTWDHPHLIVMRRSKVRSSLQRTDAAIYAATGMHTHLMRPPFGARDWIVMQVARKMGYTVVMWSVPLARDWEYPPARVIAQRILPLVNDGAIVVLHDGNRGQLCGPRRLPAHVCDRSSDIEATRLIINALKAQGYRFVTIPELISLRKSAKHTPAPGSE